MQGTKRRQEIETQKKWLSRYPCRRRVIPAQIRSKTRVRRDALFILVAKLESGFLSSRSAPEPSTFPDQGISVLELGYKGEHSASGSFRSARLTAEDSSTPKARSAIGCLRALTVREIDEVASAMNFCRGSCGIFVDRSFGG